VRKGRTEEQLSLVPMAKRGRKVEARWEWTEPSVWTERMLDALERGVKGGKWYSLIDKVYAEETLEAGWKRVKRNRGSAGVDRETIDDFQRRAETRLARLAQQIEGDIYEPKPIRRTWIPKLGSSELRPLGIPAVTDRIAETALRMTIEPIFEKKFMECSYGFRPKRGTKDALRRVQQHLDEERTFVVDIDIEKYFDTIDHSLLMEEVKKEISDGRVLRMIEKSLSRGVMETTQSYAAPEGGTPQGSVISPLLANIFLHPVDEAMTRAGYEVVRYADDCVVMCRTQEEAERAMSRMHELIEQRRLTLHPEKTKLVDATAPGGFDFLGYHFEQGRRTPRKKSLRKLKDAVREKTRRNNGYSLVRIIEMLNVIVRGWFAYFQHSARRIFGWLDSWIRGRLRSILRHRLGLRGRGRGRDHQRWTNAYFRRMGLYSMAEAHQLLIRSR